MEGSYLGPQPEDDSTRSFLERERAKFRHIPEEGRLCEEVAGLIAAEKVVGWVSGRMEFGPRALGARSILGDARSEKMQTQMNVKIKFREWGRWPGPGEGEAILVTGHHTCGLLGTPANREW